MELEGAASIIYRRELESIEEADARAGRKRTIEPIKCRD